MCLVTTARITTSAAVGDGSNIVPWREVVKMLNRTRGRRIALVPRVDQMLVTINAFRVSRSEFRQLTFR